MQRTNRLLINGLRAGRIATCAARCVLHGNSATALPSLLALSQAIGPIASSAPCAGTREG